MRLFPPLVMRYAPRVMLMAEIRGGRLPSLAPESFAMNFFYARVSSTLPHHSNVKRLGRTTLCSPPSRPPPPQQREEARQNHSLLPEGHRYVQLVSGFGCLGDAGACWGFRVPGG